MTRYYKTTSLAYRIILGSISIGYFILSLVFPDLEKDENNLNPLSLLFYSIITVTAITAFHGLSNTNRYRIFIHILVCLLTSSSLAFLICFLFSVFKNGDGNLVVTSVLSISIFVNLILLLHLIQDKRYNTAKIS